MAGLRKVPSALLRSPRVVRERWAEARAEAAGRHGDGTRVRQVALALLKTRRDRPVEGEGSPTASGTVASSGPVASRAAEGTRERDTSGVPEVSAGAVEGDAHSPAAEPARERGPARGEIRVDDSMGKQELYRIARDLGIPGRSKMSKRQLVDAIRQTSRSSSPVK